MDNTNVLTVYTSDELTNKIKGAMYDIARGFVYIGFLLAECEYFHTYLEWGYKSIYEYARSELGFKKSSVNNLINVCKTFSSNFSNVDSGFSLPFSSIMKDTYANYNYSQLVEMLSMSDKKRSLVTPDMTVKQIRELKKVETPADDSRRLENVSSYSWEIVYVDNGWYMACSSCGAPWMIDSKKHICIQTPFCYNCGVKLNKTSEVK